MDLPHAHGHSSDTSLPSRDNRGQHRPRQRPFSLPHTPSPIQQQRTESNLSTNQRRLHVRNDKFRASHFSAHNIGAKFSRIFHGQEDSVEASNRSHDNRPPSYRSEENRPPSYRSLRSSRSNDTLSTTLGILHELTNSTRSRQSLRRSAIPVFEDEPERPLLEASPTSPESIYHDASSPSVSPAVYTFSNIGSSNMRLREVSGNERRSPSALSSPLTRSVRKKRTRNLNLRKSSFDSVNYIEGLEKELTTVKAEQYSPGTGKTYVEKLRSLQAEYNQLEGAFHDLEHHFEDRIKDAMEHKTAMEGVLRRKIKELEQMLDEKDTLIQELEYAHEESRLDLTSIDALKAAIEKLEQEKESLEDSNRSMGRRNEVLTELLAMSPTKSLQGFELSSPIRDGARKNPRPRSMMIPRLPTSPSISYSSRPHSLLGSPALPACYFSPLMEEPSQSPCTVLDGDPRKDIGDADSIDSGLAESCSIRSTTAASSRRSTMVSESSTSPSAWGFAFPVSPSEDKSTVRQPPKRKPRRFMSGSTQLKPLLLPAMTSDVASTSNSTVIPQLMSPGRRDVSEELMDPTTSFLSRSYDDRPSSNYQPLWLNGDSTAMLQQSFTEGLEPSSSTGEEDLMGFSDSSTAERGKIRAALELPEEPDPRDLADDMQDDEDVTALLQSPASMLTQSPVSAPINNSSPFLYHAQAQRKPHSGDTQTLDMEMPAADLSAMKASPHMYTPISQDAPDPMCHSEATLSAGASSAVIHESCEIEGSDLFLSLLNSVKNSPTPNPKKRRKSSYSLDEDYIISSPLQTRQNLSPSGPPHISRKVLSPASVLTRTSAVGPLRTDQSLELQFPAREKVGSHSRSPLEMLQKRSVGHRPVASVTIQTIYGTLSRYTSYIREIKRDPMALARRVIANAWCSNWKRVGKLSWWVLGLFLGPGSKRDFAQQMAGWASDWDDYDGESIAERINAQEENCRIQATDDSPRESSRSRRVRFDEQLEGYRTRGCRSPAGPALKTAKEQKTTWSQSLFLWGKFSVAILLAVGGAVVKGPAEMMRDCDEHTNSEPGTRTKPSSSPKRADAKTKSISASSRLTPFDFSMNYEPPLEPVDDNRDMSRSNVNHSPCRRGDTIHPQATGSDFQQPGRKTLDDANSSKIFTFGSPYLDHGWNRFEDGGGVKATRFRGDEYSSKDSHGRAGYKAGRKPYDPESPAFARSNDKGRGSGDGLGTLKWMQTLGLTDFTETGVEGDESAASLDVKGRDVDETGKGG